MKARRVLLVVIMFLGMFLAETASAAPGAPRIINVQGRLMNSSGALLGGTGTDYCFRFSFYDSATTGSGTKLWPSGSPSPMTVQVRNGIYNAGIGDTNIGGDTLDFNFQDTDTAYLNVEVATKVGATCAPGDGAESFETLSPRQRITASGYALNASMLGGFLAAQYASGNQIPVLESGHLVLGGTNPIVSATTTNILTLQGSSSGDLRFFNSANRISASGDATFAGALSSAGVSTTRATTTDLLVNGSFTFGSVSGILKAVAGAVAAALVDLANDVTGILGIANGGTGTSTAPSYGQLLVGNAAGGYDLVATTSLGIIANGSLFEYLFPNSATSTLLMFSGGIVSNASSTIGDGTQGGGLTVSGGATTTGSLAVQGTGTSTFASGIDIANGCFSINGECLSAGPGGGGSGVLVDIQSFTTNDTYVPSPGATIAYVIVTGGGGGGGGTDAPAADTANETVGGGGGAGATSFTVVDVAATTSVQVTVGGAGTAGANTGGTGGTGGQSRFSTFASANGGVGGGGSAVNAACAAGSWGVAGTGGSASLGDVNTPGGDGHIGDCLAEVVFGGLGGASYWGGGGRGGSDPGANSCVAGATAGAYGAGGGGAVCEDSDTGAAGGLGGGGVVVVYEYGPFTGQLGVDDGGTGTTTAPTYGQLLVGNGVGGYNLLATSSLGITGEFSTTSADHYAHSSTTIAKTYTANVFTGLQTFGNASTTNISAAYASSTSGFFGSLSVGSLTGVLKSVAGVVSASLLNLPTEVTGVLQVANGGTGWGDIAAGTLLTGNGTGAVATTTIGSSLQLSGGSLSLNLGNANNWTSLQSFANASSSLLSATRAYFGGTGTTTVDTAGNVAVGGTLNVTGNATFTGATSTNLMVTSSTTLQDYTSRNATSSLLYISGSFSGAGLSTCSGSADKLLWNSTTRQFSCGVDAGGSGSGIAAVGVLGQEQTGATQTLATSSDTNIRLSITSAGDTHTFTPSWQGTLATTRGGTGWGDIAAGTLLTGNGTGAVATTSVGSSLQIAANTLSLNLANPNTWTGLQQFSNATSSFFETVTQFARTIQSTSTNALVLRTNLAATAGLTIGSTSTPQMLAADTINKRITLGTGGASPVLFVLDTKNTGGDPNGVDGAEYYNSNTGEFRCYSGSAWRTCGGIAASSTGDVQFRNTDGSFTATSNFNWSLASNGLTIRGNAGQTSDLLTVASSTGQRMFSIGSDGILNFATTSDPTAPVTGLDFYAKDISGRAMPKWVGPAGIDTVVQPALFGNNITMWFPNTGATVAIAMGTSWTARNSGTGAAQTTPAISSGSMYNQMKRGLFSTGTTATGSSGTQSSQLLAWRGNSAGLGGFFFFARVGVDSTYASTVQMMTGLSALNAALTGEPSAQNNSIVLGKDSTDTTWQIITRSGSAATKTDTGLTIASGQVLDFYVFAAPNDSKVTVRVVEQTASGPNVVVDNLQLTNNLPVNTTFMYAHHQIRSTAGLTAKGYALNRIYVETDI